MGTSNAYLSLGALCVAVALALLAAGIALTGTVRPQVHCSQTLGPGGDLAAKLDSAAPGAVLCLQAGAYPLLRLEDLAPAGYVTLRSAPGQRATLAGVEAQAITHIRLQDLRLSAPISITRSAQDVQLIGDEISNTTCGLYLYAWSGHTIDDLLVADDYIHDLTFTGPEDVCSGYGIIANGEVNDVSIRDSTIARVANDYIQTAGGDDWTVDHNTFLGPSLRTALQAQTRAGVHQDLWQFWGSGSHIAFTNNVARDTGTNESLLFQSGEIEDVTISNNLFDHDSEGYSAQIFPIQGLEFTHNTFVGSHWGVIFRTPDSGSESQRPGSGYVVTGNVFGATLSGSPAVIEQPNYGLFDYNVSADQTATGPHSVRGWHARWVNETAFQPLCLRLAAGYTPASSESHQAFYRRWNSGCS